MLICETTGALVLLNLFAGEARSTSFELSTAAVLSLTVAATDRC